MPPQGVPRRLRPARELHDVQRLGAERTEAVDTPAPIAASAPMPVPIIDDGAAVLIGELIACHLNIAKLLLSEPVDHENRAEIRTHLHPVRELTKA